MAKDTMSSRRMTSLTTQKRMGAAMLGPMAARE